MPAALLLFALSAHAQSSVVLPPLGGPGGANQFVLRCPESQHLTGFELRVGDDVDAIQPICVSVYGPAELAGPPEPYYPKWGGNKQLVCPAEAPIVIGMEIGAEGVHATIVNNIHLWCGVAATTQKLSELPNAVFDGPPARAGDFNIFGGGGKEPRIFNGKQYCPAGMVAIGINGRTGYWLDAVGLICGAPKLTPKTAPPPEPAPRPVNTLGRVKSTNTLGRVKLEGALPSRSICESARGARARNSPAAPGLEARCRADLAAKGAAIAEQDPMVAEARAAETDALYQQGFDIATGIFGDPALGARGNTATGPGSLGIRDALSAVGQRGFNASVKLHLSRDYKQTPVQATPTITANPNPVMVANGQASGATTIAWKAGPDYTYCEIYLSVDNGEWTEFARGRDGTKPTTIKLGSSHTFRMMVYEGQAGTPKIITTLTVTAKN